MSEPLTPEKIEALLREAYLYPRATMPEGLVPDLADALKQARAEITALRAEKTTLQSWSAVHDLVIRAETAEAHVTTLTAENERIERLRTAAIRLHQVERDALRAEREALRTAIQTADATLQTSVIAAYYIVPARAWREIERLAARETSR